MKGTLFCEHRTIEDVDPEHLQKIAELEKELGYELTATCGCRCPECNEKARGKQHSAHKRESHKKLKSCATDISIQSGRERFNIVKAAFKIGFRRIEDRDTWIHLDNGKEEDGFAQDVMF